MVQKARYSLVSTRYVFLLRVVEKARKIPAQVLLIFLHSYCSIHYNFFFGKISILLLC